MHEEIHKFWQILAVFYKEEEGHFGVYELSGDCVEVYFDGKLLLAAG